MRVTLFGSRGQLGRDIARVFEPKASVAGFDLPELDIADADAVESCLADTTPACVINAAAYTDVEGAEDDREGAYRANEEGARVVAAAAERRGLPVVHISTDFVFDGTKRTPYEPGDPVAPRGVYAKSKAAGEAAVREANPHHFIVRTAWLYGPGGNNFVEKILAAAQARPSLNVVDDEVGSPTHTLDLASAVAALCDTRAWGTYHAVNGGSCSRFEFAKEILRLAGIDTPVEPCKAIEFPSKAPRPAYSVLSNDALERATGLAMPDWKPALAAYMKRRETGE